MNKFKVTKHNNKFDDTHIPAGIYTGVQIAEEMTKNSKKGRQYFFDGRYISYKNDSGIYMSLFLNKNKKG